MAILPNMQSLNNTYLTRKNQLAARTKVLKALAHPTRLFIVEELEQGERCVCELTEMIGADVSTISKHLSVLKQAGLVFDDKRGNMVFYQLRVSCVLGFLDCVEKVLRSQAEDYAACMR